MYSNVIYALMMHCMIKLRPDLQSTHQASHFGIWLVQIRQIEVDINQFNILELGRAYLSGQAGPSFINLTVAYNYIGQNVKLFHETLKKV